MQQRINKLLSDLCISDSEIKASVDCYFDQDKLSSNLKEWIAISPASAPLIAMIDGNFAEALKFEQNVDISNEFLSGLYKYYEDDLQSPEIISIHNNPEFSELKHILSGSYVIQLLQERIVKIDYKDYSFDSAKQMLYILGAHISNTLQRNDSREVEALTPGSSILYRYENDSHGDFRFSQYDLSTTSALNPYNLDETLPFGIPKFVGRINGYHSVEASFLCGLLYFIHQQGLTSVVLSDFDGFLVPFYKQGQSFGNYADAGMYDAHSIGLHFIGFEQGETGNIYTLGDCYYQLRIENENLNYYLVHPSSDQKASLSISISKEMIDEVLTALFMKVATGNGRSSLNELKDVIEYYLEHALQKTA